MGKPNFCEYDKVVYYHCWCYQCGKDCKFEKDYGIGRDTEYKLATEDEKRKLFNIIKENGYEWNAETKTLEKLIEPKFKVGDRIKWIKNGNIYEIIKILSNCYIANYLGSDITILWNRQDDYELVPNYKFKVGDKIVKKDNPTRCWYVQGNIDSYYCIVTEGGIANLPLKDQDDWELAPTPKFKVDDIVETKKNKLFDYKIIKITDTHYTLESIPGKNTYDVLICEDENWKLVPNKFDISTLKAYDKVLVRDDNNSAWINAFFGFYDTETTIKYPFVASAISWSQCIPYEGNEHLLGTNNDCDEYYKNW